MIVNAQSQDHLKSIFVKKSEINQIIRYDEGRTPIIYQTSEKAVYKIQVSKNQFISAIEVTEGVLDGRGYEVTPQHKLIIISPDGRLIDIINDNIQEYDWSPNSDKIAYITGSYSETGRYGFRPDGKAYIYNINTKVKMEIDGINNPIGVFWGRDENTVYVKDARKKDGKQIYRYILDSEYLEITDYHDFYFSPSEEYYFSLLDMDHTFTLYKTDTNQPMQLPDNLGKPVTWISNNGHHLIFEKKVDDIVHNQSPQERKAGIEQPKWSKSSTPARVVYSVYDVKQGKVVKEEHTDMVSEWIGNKYTFPIQDKNNSIKKLSLDELKTE